MSRPAFRSLEKEQAKQDRNGRLDRVNGSLKVPTASKRFIAANAVMLIVIFAFVLYVIDQLRAGTRLDEEQSLTI